MYSIHRVMKREVFIMQVGICDDDAQCRNYLKSLLQENNIFTEPIIISEFSSVQQLSNQLKKVDILFLDIEVGTENSLTYLAQTILLQNYETLNEPIIVLVSSHPCYVTQSYQLPIFQFLLKPVQPALFAKVFIDCQKQYLQMHKHCTVQTEQGVDRILPLKQIVCIKSEKQKIFYYADDYKWYHSKEGSLLHVVEQLQYYGFCQIHKSYIINLAFLSQLKNDSVTLSINHKTTTLPIGEKYSDHVHQQYLQFLATKGAT